MWRKGGVGAPRAPSRGGRVGAALRCPPQFGGAVLELSVKVSGFEFRVKGLGCGLLRKLEFRVEGLGFRVNGSGFRVEGLGFRV
jgi:hypothetical protein